METTVQVKTERIEVGADQFIGLFGIREENLPLFKDELGVELFTHGGEIVITGEPEKVDLAKLTFEKLVEILLRGENVDRTRIRYAIELAAEGKADPHRRDHARRDRHHLPRQAGQVQDAGTEAVRRGDSRQHLLFCRRACRHGKDLSRHRHGGGRQ